MNISWNVYTISLHVHIKLRENGEAQRRTSEKLKVGRDGKPWWCQPEKFRVREGCGGAELFRRRVLFSNRNSIRATL